MTEFFFDPRHTRLTATGEDFDLNPSLSEVAKASAKETFFDYGSGNFDGILRLKNAQNLDNIENSFMSPQEANERFPGPNPNVKLFDRDVGQYEAGVIQKLANERFERNRVLEAAKGFGEVSVKHLTSLATFLLDPLSIATFKVPGAPAALIKGVAQKFGPRTASALGLGTQTGAAITVFNTPRYYRDSLEQGNFDVTGFITESTLATVLGAGIGTFVKSPDVKKALDPLEDFNITMETHQNAQKVAAAQMLEGRQVNVEPIFKAEKLANSKITTKAEAEKASNEVSEIIASGEANEATRDSILKEIPKNEVVGHTEATVDEVIKNTEEFITKTEALLPEKELETFRKEVTTARANLTQEEVKIKGEVKGINEALNCIRSNIT